MLSLSVDEPSIVKTPFVIVASIVSTSSMKVSFNTSLLSFISISLLKYESSLLINIDASVSDFWYIFILVPLFSNIPLKFDDTSFGSPRLSL